MATKSTKLLERFQEKVKKTKELQEFEWDGLKLQCPHRKRRKGIDGRWEHGCEKCNKSPANKKGYFYYCHYSNCAYT